MSDADTIIEPAPVEAKGAALIWQRKWWVVAASVLGLLGAAFYLRTVTFRYAATMTVTPISANTSSLPTGVSGLANLVGVSTGRGEVAKPFILYLQLLASDDIAAQLARDAPLKKHVFAAQWDDAAQRWRQPASLTRGVTTAVKSALGIPLTPWAPPGRANVKEWLVRRLSVAEDPKNGIARVSLSDTDPEFARRTLARISDLADSELRVRELERTRDYISYLTRTIATVTLAEHRSVLALTLGDQERKRMIAAADTPFAAEPLGPIVADDHPTSPDAVMTVVAWTAGGALLGCLLALNWPRRRWN